MQHLVNNAGFGTKTMIKIKCRTLQQSIVLDNISNLINANEVSGLYDKLSVKLNNSPLSHVLTKEEIINKMQEKYKNMMPNEAWDHFKTNVGSNLHFVFVE